MIQVKKALGTFYVLIIVMMAMATVIARYKGDDYVADRIYGSWWFSLLWALGVAEGTVYFIQRKVRRPFIVILHLSFVVILAGAFLTHITSAKGMVHLRQGKYTAVYTSEDGHELPLPFSIRLNRFRVSYHAGNAAAMDYISAITVREDDKEEHYEISMNHIYNGYGIRLCQSSYDEDMRGSYLSINSDPYGIPVTYIGYGLLFLGLIGMLFDKNGRFRQLLRSETMRKTAIILFILTAGVPVMQAQTVLPKETATQFGKLFIVYNGRICPTETFAIDFTKKLYGKARYKDFTPCQVLTGFMFWGQEWMAQPVIRIKGKVLRQSLGLQEYVAPTQFFNQRGYILGPYLTEAQNRQDNFSRQVLDTDDKMMLIMTVARGEVLKMFPFPMKDGSIRWFSPMDKLPAYMPKDQQTYVHSILVMANQLAVQGQYDMENDLFQKMQKYQYRYGGSAIPSHTKIWAESVYNHILFATILFMVNLTLGFISIFFLTRKRGYHVFTWLMGLSWFALNFAMALRWIISGTVPIGNGYETMLFLGWLIMLVSLISTSKLRIMTSFGLLMSGFMLLVSHIGQMDPAITPRMPVLNSPLLSIHVSIIMIAYALLSLTFVAAIAYFLTARSKNRQVMEINAQLTTLSQIFLYPAMTTLGLGIFVGAIWANISWGSYWSWDPKETWALITFMIYAAALHTQSLPAFRRPTVYHLYMALAFLCIIMTYFGVNYILGGMHSYA